MAGTCECGNEPPGSIKCGEFVDEQNRLASEEGLCSVEYGLQRMNKVPISGSKQCLEVTCVVNTMGLQEPD